MKLKSLISLISLSSLLAAGAAMALPNVPLGSNIEIKPGETVKLKMDDLTQNVSYSVECELTDPNNAQNHATFNVDTDGKINYFGNIHLNDRVIGSGTYSVGTFNQVNNKLVIDAININGRSNLIFNNMEPVDSITINTCVAIAPRK